MDRGYLQVYTGCGKGKTTAAFGLALRAAGAGFKVYIGQFVKDVPDRGIALLKDRVPEIFAEQYGSGEGCYFGEGRPDELDRSSAESGVAKAMDTMLSGKYDVVILDEITIPVRYGVLDESVLLEFADRRPPSVELVMTGRYAPQSLIDRADLVTEMGEVKHYWRDGVAAREGIED